MEREDRLCMERQEERVLQREKTRRQRCVFGKRLKESRDPHTIWVSDLIDMKLIVWTMWCASCQKVQTGQLELSSHERIIDPCEQERNLERQEVKKKAVKSSRTTPKM